MNRAPTDGVKDASVAEDGLAGVLAGQLVEEGVDAQAFDAGEQR
jgi:hypothetical protein